MNILSFIFVVVVFLLINLSTVIIFKKRFGETLIFSLLIPPMLLYFSQFIFKTFWVGYIISLIYGGLSIAYLIKNKNNKKELSEIKKLYVTNGLYSFIVLCLFLLVFDFNRTFSHWDEWSHWGEMLKEMLRLDKFYSVSDSVLQVHKDYPPLLQLFELYIIKLCGSYNESYAIFSLHLIELSMFIPFLSEKINSKVKVILSSIVLFVSMLLITLLFDQHGVINSIYNDYFMAVLVSYLMVYIFYSKDLTEKFTLLNICLCGSMLLLTKQIGLPLYMMIVFLYLVLYYLNKKNFNNIFSKDNRKEIIRILLAIIIVPLIMWIGWSKYVQSLNLTGQFELSDIKITDLYKVSKGKGTYPYQTVSYVNYINAIKTTNLTTTYIQLTYIQAIILLLALIYLMLKKNKDDDKRINSLVVALILGAIGYAFVMLNIYVFCFKEIEGPNLASYDRYMDTFILVFCYILLMIIVNLSNKKAGLRYLFAFFVITLTINSCWRLQDVSPKVHRGLKGGYEECAEILKNYAPDGSKVFIVAQNSSGQYQFYVKYFGSPIIVNLNDFNWPMDKDANDYYESIKDDIASYDYIYLANIDEDFINKYGFIFNNDIKNQQVFKIVKNNDTIVYEKMN